MDRKILCVWKNDLVLVPFDDAMSGMYPRYDEAEVITNNVGIEFWDYGLLIDYDDNEFRLLIDSWDGFQPSEELGLDALKILKRLIELL